MEKSHRLFLIFSLLFSLVPELAPQAAEAITPRPRRILYNLDGDSCLTLKAERNGPGPITVEDLKTLVTDLTAPGSQVDTLLVCVNAQVMYYPTKVGTWRGTLSTPEERARWSPHETQRFATMEAFYQNGVDPYAVILAEAKRKGMEALLTFRMNDAHGNDFLRTAFWRDHPEFRLGNGALDFAHDEVRDYVFRLIEEAVQRYDCDGIELDFQRFPTFFKDGNPADNAAKINALVERVRRLLDAEGMKRDRRLVLGARVPSDYGQATPTFEQSRSLAKSCDPATWAKAGWIDFLVVSEFLFTTPTLDLPAWRQHIAGVPIYAGIQPESKPSTHPNRCEFPLGPRGYRQTARQRWTDGADGIYLFNFFTAREWPEPTEPPFEVLTQIGDHQQLNRPWQRVISGADAGGYAAFPDICRTKDGDLLVVFYSGYGHVSTPNDAWPQGGRIMAVRSSDQGGSWSRPFVVADTDHDDRDPHIAALADGTLICNWFAAAHPQKPLRDGRPLAIFLSRSTDGGMTWSDPTELVVDSKDVFACSAPIREMPDGTWILGLYTENAALNRVFGATIRSTDAGKTWQDLAPIGERSGLYLDAETDVIGLRDGTWLAALRSSKTDLYFAGSADQGKSWSEVRSAGFPGHCPHFLRHSSSVILLTHRLPATALHWSTDEGKTWQGPLVLDQVIGAYPSCVELPGGEVLCVYYEEGSGSGLRAVRLRVAEGQVTRWQGTW